MLNLALPSFYKDSPGNPGWSHIRLIRLLTESHLLSLLFTSLIQGVGPDDTCGCYSLYLLTSMKTRQLWSLFSPPEVNSSVSPKKYSCVGSEYCSRHQQEHWMLCITVVFVVSNIRQALQHPTPPRFLDKGLWLWISLLQAAVCMAFHGSLGYTSVQEGRQCRDCRACFRARESEDCLSYWVSTLVSSKD